MISKKSLLSFVAAGVVSISAVGVVGHHQDAQAANVGESVTVTKDSVGLRHQPYTNGSLTGQYVDKNTTWKVTDVTSDGQWYNVGADDWIASDDVADTNSLRDTKVQQVINEAQMQGGKPYVWGAKGPNSFDCSGLMQYVFKQALGQDIGGYTVAQESAGPKVSIDNLQPGDLMFWGSQGNSYHVALYIGNGQYIDAPKPGEGVGVHSISSYFYPSFGVRAIN
ncbi:C40 family peptidase [Bombilactobacillus folatiphilus]|uniref:C40 family peptidase n=1 Tax=Bombilactobacillus folatiphilus TaxID=2923362 RepID=UPI00294FFAB4|nr:C40 family peptidase [Bombilactobacillus folatiphilus]